MIPFEQSPVYTGKVGAKLSDVVVVVEKTTAFVPLYAGNEPDFEIVNEPELLPTKQEKSSFPERRELLIVNVPPLL